MGVVMVSSVVASWNDGRMSKAPSTQATRLLKQAGVPFTEHLYRYEEHGGTAMSARALGVDEHAVIKTLVMEDERAAPLIILMHGDLEVSTKELARQIGVKSIQPCKPEVAQRHSGYLVGGTSPFGTKKALPVHAEATIFELGRIYLNGGSRGFLVGLDPKDLDKVLTVIRVSSAIP
jgi:Cys-tRNA(Pro) deacylase